MKRFTIAGILLLLLHYSLSAQTTCSGTWGLPLVNQTFGQGNATNAWYGPLATYAPGASTSTIFVGAAGPTGGVLSDGYSGLAKVPSASGQGNWVSTTDHTGDANGLMFLINAPSTAATVFFEYVMDNLCANTTLKLSVWILNANQSSLTTNPTYQYPNMTLQAVDATTNAVLGTAESGNVAADAAWHQYSVVFSNGASTSIKLQLINNSVGSGYGNDLAIDDITVQPCVPVSSVLPHLDTLVCQNTSINFTANVTASPYNPAEYQWQYSTDGGTTWLNQGPAGPGTNYTLNTGTLAAGTYLIRFKTGPQGATVNDNCIAVSDTSIVTISAPPVLPGIDYIHQYCSGTPFVPFTIVSGTNIKWYDAPGGTPSATAPTVNTNIPGTYTWYASQTTPQGCESALLPVTVTVLQNPEADFNFTLGLGCSGDTVHFHNTTQFAGSYFWDFADGLTDTSASPDHIYSAQNVYFVKLVAQGAGGCKDSTIKSVDVTHPLQAAFTTSADTVCQGTTVVFSNTSTVTTVNNTDPQYAWTFGDGAGSSQQNPSHNYTTPGIYQAMMIATNGVPCSDTAYRTIYVDSLPQLSLTKYDTSVCAGQITTFAGSFTQNGLDNIQWNFGDNPDLIAGVNPAQHAYETPGTYTITLYGNYRVCPDVNATTTLLVKPIPVIHLGPDTSICLDDQAFTLTDAINAGNPGASWMWSNGDTTSTITIKHHGTYIGTVTIDQCSASDEVVVNKDCYIDVPNSFTPNGDGVNDYFFPRQYLSNGVAGFTMMVYNRWGQKVFETSNPVGRGWDGRFNDKEQPVGVYIYDIRVIMKNQRTEQYTGNVTLLR